MLDVAGDLSCIHKLTQQFYALLRKVQLHSLILEACFLTVPKMKKLFVDVSKLIHNTQQEMVVQVGRHCPTHLCHHVLQEIFNVNLK